MISDKPRAELGAAKPMLNESVAALERQRSRSCGWAFLFGAGGVH
jgi:hypothetical protein